MRINLKTMKINIFVTLTITTFAIACGSKYANVKIKDANPESNYVYGEKDAPAKQLKNTYPAATPETVEKASKFRELVESELVSAKK